MRKNNTFEIKIDDNEPFGDYSMPLWLHQMDIGIKPLNKNVTIKFDFEKIISIIRNSKRIRLLNIIKQIER